MFGIGWPEFLLILAVAVVVIGPKDLPVALHSAGKLFRKFRKIAADFQQSLDEVMKEGELDEIIREANKPGGDDLQFEIDRQAKLENQKKDSNV